MCGWSSATNTRIFSWLLGMAILLHRAGLRCGN